MTARGPPTFDDGLTNTAGARGVLCSCLHKDAYTRTPGRFRRLTGGRRRSSRLSTTCRWLPVHEPECQLVNHVALIQLDGVDTEPIDACNGGSSGVRAHK